MSHKNPYFDQGFAFASAFKRYYFNLYTFITLTTLPLLPGNVTVVPTHQSLSPPYSWIQQMLLQSLYTSTPQSILLQEIFRGDFTKIDNIFVQFGELGLQQTVGNPMGTNRAPLLADIFHPRLSKTFFKSYRRKKKES